MYKKILIAIDHTDPASWDKALPIAVEEAKHHGATLSAISVVPEILKLPNLPENYGDGAMAFVKEAVEKIVGSDIPVSVRQGSVYREILEEAHAIGADLIVMASTREDFPDSLLGPSPSRVVSQAHCSVLIIRR